MNKIGVFFSLNNYGGVQTCVISLIRGLNRVGIIPDLLTDQPVNQKIIDEFSLNLNIVKIRYSIPSRLAQKISLILQGAFDMVYFFKTSRLKKKYDFIYIFTPRIIVNNNLPHLYYLSMAPRFPGFSGRKMLPHVKFFVYDYFYKYFVPVYELHGTIENYVINSQFTADMFQKTYGQKVRVIYPSNLIKTPAEIDYSKKSAVIFISRIVPAKRPEMFIQLAEEFPSEQFIMIGSADSADYVAKLNRIITSKNLLNIEIITNLPFNTILEYLLQARIYVFTAINEHFGITTVEAMMYGIIPFVHNSGGQKEIVPWENLRFDDHDFINKFSSLLTNNPDSITEIRSMIKVHVEKFSEQRYLEAMLAYIQ